MHPSFHWAIASWVWYWQRWRRGKWACGLQHKLFWPSYCTCNPEGSLQPSSNQPHSWESGHTSLDTWSNKQTNKPLIMAEKSVIPLSTHCNNHYFYTGHFSFQRARPHSNGCIGMGLESEDLVQVPPNLLHYLLKRAKTFSCALCAKNYS